MAEGIVSNLVAKAIECLCKAASKEVFSWWGARDELKKLENTMRLIQVRVHDAERRNEDDGSDAIKEWLRRLKLVLYQADDLFDEVLTRDRQKQQMESSTMAKVGILFSKSGPFNYNRTLANEIKSIRKDFDAIKSDMAGLNLTNLPAQELSQPIDRLIKKRETASFVNTEDVVGRIDDQNIIVDMLIDPKYDDKRVTVIPIVGFGGLGKTTLAQLIFNDERVKKHFDLTKWAYVSDKDNLVVIMGKIYKSFTGNNYGDRSLEEIKQGISKSIEAKNYLLVLDGIWDGGDSLVDLLNLLKCGNQGSKAIVTTRSDVVARTFGTIDDPYRLGTLTDDQSWDLFKLVAFKEGKLDNNPSFNVIGKEIVKMCGNIPLSIKVVGGFLRFIDTEEQWLQARDAQRSKAQLPKGNDIMDVLKLSYNYLPPVLKQCFSFCSLSDKGDSFSKDELVFKWMALGYFGPPYENSGDQLFLELLARALFQDPEFSDEGDVQYCKMHDLVHDLAQCVAGEETKFLGDTSSSQITHGLIHANVLQSQPPPSLFVARRMRSLLLNQQYGSSLEGLIERFKYLRVLSIKKIKIEEIKLLNSVEKLIHLRYLNIKSGEITHLPGSITRLPNLQTLVVDRCRNLSELPSDFVKLASLRHLLLPQDNDAFTDLPSEFGKLTSLQRLNVFHVGKSNGIDALPSLNLRGKLHIKFNGGRRNAILEVQRANLKNNNQLTALSLSYITTEADSPFDEINEMLMHLQLPLNLKKLKVKNYKGYRMLSSWFYGLSKLVSVTIMWCKCKVLPDLSQLPYLEYVRLEELDELEYVEDEDNMGIGCQNLSSATHNNYFPSLEVLQLDDLPRLKGWTRASQDDREGRQLLFPNLLRLEVAKCPELMSMPMTAPKLESLSVRDMKWAVFGSNVESHDDGKTPASGSLPSFLSSVSKSLQNLHLCKVDLVSLSIGCSLGKLNQLLLYSCDKLESLRFESPNSIQILNIENCMRLRNIEGLQWEALSSLHSLVFSEFSNWKKLPSGIAYLTSLQNLYIGCLKNLTKLPQDIGNLSSLRLLRIWRCPELKSLPTSLLRLSSLQTLYIRECPYLKERYKQPNGEDWHLIQHIPNLDLV